jgi:hypothetical protein
MLARLGGGSLPALRGAARRWNDCGRTLHLLRCTQLRYLSGCRRALVRCKQSDGQDDQPQANAPYQQELRAHDFFFSGWLDFGPAEGCGARAGTLAERRIISSMALFEPVPAWPAGFLPLSWDVWLLRRVDTGFSLIQKKIESSQGYGPAM